MERRYAGFTGPEKLIIAASLAITLVSGWLVFTQPSVKAQNTFSQGMQRNPSSDLSAVSFKIKRE